MATKTLSWISEVGSEPDSYGNLYVNVSFTDGTAGYIASKEHAQEHQTALAALKDQEGEFVLEEKGTTKKGATRYKINGYPGWERPAYGGGGGGGKSSWYNSEEGVRYTQERTDRRTALMQAVAVADSPDAVFDWAQSFYDWIRETSGSVAAGAPSLPSLPAPAPVAADGLGKAVDAAPDEQPAAQPVGGEEPPTGPIHAPNCPMPGWEMLANGKVKCQGCRITAKPEEI